MVTSLVKIDRVTSVEEAIELQNLGINFISINLYDDVRYSDNRIVNIEVAKSIRLVLKQAKFVVEININISYEEIMHLIKELQFDFIQIAGNFILTNTIIDNILKQNIGIIFSNIYVSYEDDPSWILSKYDYTLKSDLIFFQIDLLGDMENSWEYLKKEAFKFPEELQIADIYNLTKSFPLFITLDYSKENIDEIITKFPAIQGISLTIADLANRNDIHFYSFFEVVQIFKHL